MIKIVDDFITGFFVVCFGIPWYLSTKYIVRPNQYQIVVYDALGKEFSLEGIRTSFKTKQVAISFVKEYSKRFPHYDFSIGESIPEVKRSIFSIQRDQR